MPQVSWTLSLRGSSHLAKGLPPGTMLDPTPIALDLGLVSLPALPSASEALPDASVMATCVRIQAFLSQRAMRHHGGMAHDC